MSNLMVPCTNCNEPVPEEQCIHHAYTLQDLTGANGLPWCCPECFLCTMKASLPIVTMTALRTSVSDRYDRPVRERPPRKSLRNWGGHMTLDEYHGRTSQPHATQEKRSLNGN